MSRQETEPDKPVEDLDRRVGIAIKRLRGLVRMTQEELAKRAHVSQAYVSLTENGRRNTRMNLKTLQRIARILGMTKLSELIRAAEDIPDARTVIAEAAEYFNVAGDADGLGIGNETLDS